MDKATRINLATLGTIFGISGMSHGFFKTLQGNVPTRGLFIFAIGEAQKMRSHGNEPAFTIIPNSATFWTRSTCTSASTLRLVT